MPPNTIVRVEPWRFDDSDKLSENTAMTARWQLSTHQARAFGVGAAQQSVVANGLIATFGNLNSAAEISATYQQKLFSHSDNFIRQRAGKIFQVTRKDRQAVLQEYESVARLKGDVGKGVAVFQQNCAACHRFHGEGAELGPDLAGLAGKDAPTLLAAILDPNRAVEARYLNYAAVTTGGVELNGLIVSENPTSLTLRAPGGKEEVLLRKELKELTSSGLSLMPEGFEKILSPQDVADLLGFLNAPGGKP